MSGLTEEAGGVPPKGEEVIDQARLAWQKSMLRQMGRLCDGIKEHQPETIADRCGGTYREGELRLTYWGKPIAFTWPDLQAHILPDKSPCSTFDHAMLLYYLHTADDSPMGDRWIAFRELPDGGFYHQAFQGYSGDLIAHQFGGEPERLTHAGSVLHGWSLPTLAPYAYAFQPLPRIRLAVVLWPGDEDFLARASVLFDAAASHYLPTDGLALLGAGLARRLIRAEERA